MSTSSVGFFRIAGRPQGPYDIWLLPGFRVKGRLRGVNGDFCNKFPCTVFVIVLTGSAALWLISKSYILQTKVARSLCDARFETGLGFRELVGWRSAT